MDALKIILIEKNKFNDVNYYFMQQALKYKYKYLMNKHDDLFLTADSLICFNNIITGSNSTELRNVNVKPACYCRMYMDKNDIEHALHALVDNFNNYLITRKDFCEKFLDRIHPFRDGIDRMCKISFMHI